MSAEALRETIEHIAKELQAELASLTAEMSSVEDEITGGPSDVASLSPLIEKAAERALERQLSRVKDAEDAQKEVATPSLPVSTAASVLREAHAAGATVAAKPQGREQLYGVLLAFLVIM
eukprot:7268318-Ditylum_brightwellii.AAC.1